MVAVLPILALLACARPAEEPPPLGPVPAPPAAAGPERPGEGSPEAAEALYRALSVRDGAPSCAELGAYSEDLVAELVGLVQQAPPPPWVQMRAVDCLARSHTAAALPELRVWVADPQGRGLCLAVLGALEEAPSAEAVELAQAALAGPWAEDARERLARSARPELSALAQVR